MTHRAPDGAARLASAQAGNGLTGAARSDCHGEPLWYPPQRCTGCGHRAVIAASGLRVPATRSMNWRYWLAELTMRAAARHAGKGEHG